MKIRKYIKLKLLTILFVSCLISASGSSTWKQLSNMNIARNVFALVPCNGKLYAIGGENQTLLKSVEVYDPQTNKWEMKTDIPEPLSWCQGFEIEGIIYIVCNQTTQFNWTKAVYAYNTSTDNWSRMADMPVCTPYMKAAMVDGHIYVLSASSLIKYIHSSDKWETICTLDPARDNDVTCIGLDNKIYAVGKTATVFDIQKLKWAIVKPLPTPRTGIGLVVANQRIYAISGWIDDINNWYSRNLESFHPEANEWTVKLDLPAATNHLPAYAAMNGKIYYAGGLIYPSRYTTTLKTVYEYDPVQDTVNTVADYDGNSYNTIKIGKQVWMKENLRSEHYADGKNISGVFNYVDSTENKEIFGKFYTLPAATNGIATQKTQGACPTGWHLPDSTEWIELIEHLDGKNIAGEKLKANSYLWNSNDESSNTSGFSALPAGMILNNNTSLVGLAAFFWTSSSFNQESGCVYDVYYTSSGIEKDICNKNDAVSVRCIKNSSVTAKPTNKNPEIKIYPNPFSTSVNFIFSPDNVQRGFLSVFDMNGQMVSSQSSLETSPQNDKIVWNDNTLPSAEVYIYKLKIGEQIITGKLFKK